MTSSTCRYVLTCSSCRRRLADDGKVLDCPGGHAPALLRTEYANSVFTPSRDRSGLFRYREWLPVSGGQEDVGGTSVYRSEGLAKALGLRNLWIAFNGYWPERGAGLVTATFKELEAYTVLGRLRGSDTILTVASSGNTGAAFAWACSQRGVPCLVIVPGKSLHRFRFPAPLREFTRLVTIADGDYPDAMELAAVVSEMPYFHAEGGVKNVGRRDGLGTVLLAAFEAMRCLPAYYFQAVGSGTGAIAVLEAARRLAGLAGGNIVLPRLMMCQNLPFTPIYEAWRSRKHHLITESTEKLRVAARDVYADELTNWRPPYDISGGAYDALTVSQGDVLVVDNASARVAAEMFAELEGVDIEPAAGVALACLHDAVIQGRIDSESVVQLNVTGGGRLRLSHDFPLVRAEPQLQLARCSLASDAVQGQIAGLFGIS